MATEIKCEKIDSGLIHVNGKEVRLDMNGNWVNPDLSITEAKVFRQFMNSYMKNKERGLKLQSAAYIV